MNVSGLLCFRVLRRSVLARGAVPSAVYGAHLFLSVLAPLVTELGGEGYPIPPVRYRLADEPLVGKGPSMSAVSRKVTPISIARWIVAIDSSSSVGPIELAHPHTP